MPRAIQRGRLRLVRPARGHAHVNAHFHAPVNAPVNAPGTDAPGMHDARDPRAAAAWSAAAASLLLPGVGQWMQARRRAAAVHVVGVALVLAAPMPGGWRFAAVCALGVASALDAAFDAARAQRLARRPPLRRM